jgi:hypothetical protein
VTTSGRVYDDFVRHTHREASVLVGESPEGSDQFPALSVFQRAARLANLKVSVGLILAKASVMKITIPIDLSTRTFVPQHGCYPLPERCLFNINRENER